MGKTHSLGTPTIFGSIWDQLLLGVLFSVQAAEACEGMRELST